MPDCGSVNIGHSKTHAGMLDLEKGHGCWRIPREGETTPEELESSLDLMVITPSAGCVYYIERSPRLLPPSVPLIPIIKLWLCSASVRRTYSALLHVLGKLLWSEK